MRSLAALLALLLCFVPSIAPAASLDRDWARIYNPPGNESALAMWPSPGGGVDIAADHDGQLVYLKYDQVGNLAAERQTGVGIGTMWFRVLESDGVGGFVVAALQDSSGVGGLTTIRVSPNGGILWRGVIDSSIRYPHAIDIKNGQVYLATDEDYGTSYDPDLVRFDLDDGFLSCDSFSIEGPWLWTDDIEVMDDGRIFLIGHTNSGCDCHTFIRRFEWNCNVLDTSPYPGMSFAQLEEASSSRYVLLGTSAPHLPLASAAFTVTWFSPHLDVPTEHEDSRDLLGGGCRAHILERMSSDLVFAGEHDAGGGAQELLIGSIGESYSVDVDLVRPNAIKSYKALELEFAAGSILEMGVETNVGGSSPKRIALLFDEDRVLQDYDLEGNLPSPVSMAIGEDGGIYTVGAGGPPGIVLTKLLISGVTGVPAAEAKAPTVSRLGLPSPNPATSSVRLEYDVAREGVTTLEIYDPAGRLVTRLVDGKPSPGQHVAEWDTRNVAKGVYLARFKSGDSYAARKIVIE